MNSTAEQIRERFLHKIGIHSPQHVANSTDSALNSISANNTIQTETGSSCLGAVKPTYEPLKVGLDDDSSIEGDDEHDDDFYFGDDQLPTEMDIDAFLRNCHNEVPKRGNQVKSKKSKIEVTNNQINERKMGDTSIEEPLNVVSDQGSSNSSLDGTSITSSIYVLSSSIGKFIISFLLVVKKGLLSSVYMSLVCKSTS